MTQIHTTPTADGSRIQVSFQYDPLLISSIRKIPGAKFDTVTKTWSVAKRYAAQVEVLRSIGVDADKAWSDLASAWVGRIWGAAPNHVTIYVSPANRTYDVSPKGKAFLGALRSLRGARSRKVGTNFVGYSVHVEDEGDFADFVEALKQVAVDARQKADSVGLRRSGSN